MYYKISKTMSDIPDDNIGYICVTLWLFVFIIALRYIIVYRDIQQSNCNWLFIKKRNNIIVPIDNEEMEIPSVVFCVTAEISTGHNTNSIVIDPHKNNIICTTIPIVNVSIHELMSSLPWQWLKTNTKADQHSANTT
jgi:hypothetical protein